MSSSPPLSKDSLRFESLRAAFQEVKAELVALRSVVSRMSSAAVHPRQLLSLRAAAKQLGVDRTKVIAKLVREGRVRVVLVNNRPRIPASELVRIAQEGFSSATLRPRPARRPLGTGSAASIRDLDF